MLGWAKDIYSLPTALALSGIIFLVLSIIAGILFISHTSSTSPS